MHNGHESELHIKVNAFKAWAKSNCPEITEDNDNGEWCFYDKFGEMVSYALSIIQKCPAASATEQMIDDLLYVIARDNECESIVKELVVHIDWFSLLCRHSLKTHYANAKWQFAKNLCNYNGNDEYQKIMVLHVLYQIRSPKLCYYLELAEHSNHKYLKTNAQEIREK